MATIIDVARYAGVSKSTVSLVLNNSPLVKEETRIHVEKAIQALGYVCNNNARGLRTKETKCLGVIIAIERSSAQSYDYNHETGLYSYNITNGIPDGLLGTDYGLITERYCAKDANGSLPQAVHNGRIDGAFLVGGLFDNAIIDAILKRGLPTVAVGRYYEQIDSVSVDVSAGTKMEVSHLLETGHRKIAYINCPQIYRSSQDRLCGLQQALKPYNGQVEQTWTAYCAENTGEGGYLAMKKLWESGARPDGIAAANEPIAMGIMRYLYEQKIRIPDDVSVIAYEDSVLGGYATPALTTVNIHKEQMGAIAANLLLKRMEAPERPLESRMVQPQLILRASVAQRK